LQFRDRVEPLEIGRKPLPAQAEPGGDQPDGQGDGGDGEAGHGQRQDVLRRQAPEEAFHIRRPELACEGQREYTPRALLEPREPLRPAGAQQSQERDPLQRGDKLARRGKPAFLARLFQPPLCGLFGLAGLIRHGAS
jgi:hypothetical protein